MLADVTYIPYDEEKLTELVLYVARETKDDWASGATKLNKYLYFADFAAMRRLGRPITGAEYQKLKLGPAPRRLPPVRDSLIRTGAAELEQRADPLGYVHHRLIPKRDPRDEIFIREELALVDEIIEALRNLNAAQVSELSHSEAGWQLVEEGETIPYELAFVLPPSRAERTPAITAEGERLLAQYADQLG